MSDRSLFISLPVNARNSIRLRRTEKRLLARTIASTERRLDDLRDGAGKSPLPLLSLYLSLSPSFFFVLM